MPGPRDVHDEAEFLIARLGHSTVLRVLRAAQQTADLIQECVAEEDAAAWKDASGRFGRLQPLLDHKVQQ